MERRIIFVDDDAMSEISGECGQVGNYVKELTRKRISIGPTRGFFAEFSKSLHNGVFHRVDGAIEYFDQLVRSDTEWNNIHGMIIDAQMPPGTFLSNKRAVRDEMLSGSMLILYLSQQMVEQKRFGMNIYLLTNHKDSMKRLKEAYEHLLQEADDDPMYSFVGFTDEGHDNVRLDESGIRIRYCEKATVESKAMIPPFVNAFEDWMQELDAVRRTVPIVTPLTFPLE